MQWLVFLAHRVMHIFAAGTIFFACGSAVAVGAEESASTRVVAYLDEEAARRFDGFWLADMHAKGELRPESLGLRLGIEVQLTPLIVDPISLDRLPDGHPEARLQRYLVFSFVDPESARRGLESLRSYRDVIEAVGLDVYFTPSATPSNSLYPTQYALPLMNFPSAWDLVRGHAWVAVLDTGLQSHSLSGLHPSFSPSWDLDHAFRPHFAWNENIYSGLPPSYPYPPSSGGVRHVDEIYDWPNHFDDGVAVNYGGHGTHVAGIIAAQTKWLPTWPPPPPSGTTAGACPGCSLEIIKVNDRSLGIPGSRLATSIRIAARQGAQVINMSLGANLDPEYDCSNPYGLFPFMSAICDSIEWASLADAVMVAAAGNENLSDRVNFPARDERVIPVGGVEPVGNVWQRWYESANLGSNSSVQLRNHGVVAPARDVVSTTYAGKVWSPDARCGDASQGALYQGGHSLLVGVTGFGTCTGTSMSTPHVSGLIALMRSIDPLMSSETLRGHLRAASRQPDGSIGTSNAYGAGLPNAGIAVDRVLAQTNRLTPLFGMVHPYRNGMFFTTSPQMANAAHLGTMPPGTPSPSGWSSYYNNFGNQVRYNGGWYVIPHLGDTALADVWIFTTHINPKSSTIDLLPLYRLSYLCVDTAPAAPHAYCATNPHKQEHVYSTSKSEVNSFIAQGFRYEGIEGYVYPASQPKPVGTVSLMRAYKPSEHGYALFPEDRQSYYAGFGFTSNVTTIGYVYRNPVTGIRPTY
ncbi:MAG: S8 family serine peptidase [Lysobacteraceae bacterium]